MAEFKSHDYYWQFSRSVVRGARHVFEPLVYEFLNTVIATLGARIEIIEPQSVLRQAQLGFQWQEFKIDPDDPDSETDQREAA